MREYTHLSRMQIVFAIFDDVVERRLMRTLIEKDLNAIADFLKPVIVTRRLYRVRTEKDVNELWQLIAQNEVLVDFVLNLSAELHIWLEMSEVGVSDLIAALGAAYGQHRNDYHSKSANNKSLINADTLDRLPSPAEVEGWCKANCWLVSLYLINLRGMSVFAKLPKIISEQNDTKGGSK